LFTRPSKKKDEELKAAQEAINQKNFTLQTNMSLEHLRKNIVELTLQCSKDNAFLDNGIKLLKVDFENLSQFVKEECATYKSKLNDVQDFTVKEASCNLKKLMEIDQDYVSLDDHAHCIIESQQVDNELRNLIRAEHSHINSQVTLIKGQINTQIDFLRKDFKKNQDMPCPYTIALEKKIKDDDVTRQGLVKEIELLKRQTAYNTKQFEYVVNQLQRLKGIENEPSR